MRQMLAYHDIFSRFVLDKNQKLMDESAKKPKMQMILDSQMKDVLEAGINGSMD